MRATVLAVSLLAATACTKNTIYYCDEATPCQISGTVCDLPHNTCVEVPDAPPGDDDGPMPDASGGPVVDTFQPAALVLGQPDFTSSADQGCVRDAAKAIGVAEGN